jgi:hypothetical protein
LGRHTVLISPRFGPEKLASGRIEDFIDVYEDRIKGWMLDRADQMAQLPHGEFAALAIALSYFEPYWSFVSGRNSDGRSRRFFREGFVSVFPTPTPGRGMGAPPVDFQSRVANYIYERARCGLFHSGMARTGILVAGYPQALNVSANLETFEIGAVIVNVRIVISTIRYELDKYLAKVRDAAEEDVRRNFLAAWGLMHAGDVVILPPEPPDLPPAGPPPPIPPPRRAGEGSGR